MKMKNKKGDISTTVLVIGVLVVVTLALLSFSLANSKAKNSFLGLEKLKQAKILIEKNSLNHYNDEVVHDEFVFNPKSGWVETKLIFSVEYFNPDGE